MRTGEWNQEGMIANAEWVLKKHGYDGYHFPGDIEDKIEGITGRIGRRIFAFPRMRSDQRNAQKNLKKSKSYDYVYKNYILAVLLNFKHHIECFQFDYQDYSGIVEKNLLEQGHSGNRPAGNPEDIVDKIIRVYEERIFEYPGKGE
jgi:hypothetical protein